MNRPHDGARSPPLRALFAQRFTTITHDDERSTMSEYRIQEATTRRQQQEAQLYRSDGSKYFSDQEHAERMAAIRAEHARAFDAIEADLADRADRAQAELEALEHADPAAGLSTEELQRAAATKAFVADEMADLSLADLARRCRAAASSSGDKASMYALAHHAARRVGEPDVTSDVPGAEEVREAVADLRTKIAPDQERRLADAREALEEAQALREQAYYRRRGVRDAFDLYARNTYWTSPAQS